MKRGLKVPLLSGVQASFSPCVRLVTPSAVAFCARFCARFETRWRRLPKAGATR